MKDKIQNSKKETKRNQEVLNQPINQSIYSKDKSITNTDVQKISTNDQIDKEENLWNENAFDKEQLGSDLDVPGAELDDKQEIIGNEDEENNY